MIGLPPLDDAAAAPSEDIARALSRAILEHRIPPGAKLSEDEVGEIYGAGRTVVRGALGILARRNLVTIRRNRGAFVAKPDPREAREVFEARALLEPRTARSAAERARPETLDQLRRSIAEEHRALAEGDIGTAVYLSGLFHCAIAEMADQKTIADFIVSLVSRSSLIIALYWRRRDTLCESHAHHALVDAFAAGDGQLAEELMGGHLVDLLSGLDLRERGGAPRSLREMVAGGGMSAARRIAVMSPADLGLALDWAAAEGWNPGLDDAAAFRAADPEGFLMAWVETAPVAAISVVRHSEAFGFLGLYLCHPDWRGRGHGWALWQAGLAHLGGRVIGLDGVVAQQANYARSGFVAVDRNRRWTGRIEGRAGPGIVPASLEMLPELLAWDRRISGVAREAYLTAWLDDTATRRTLVALDAGRVAGFGTIRACRVGAKVGPLVAESPGVAEALLGALAAVFPGAEVSVDMPEGNAAAGALARRLGLAPGFETARMYKGQAPAGAGAALYGVVSLELG